MKYVSFTFVYWIIWIQKILESSKNLVPVSKGVSQVKFIFMKSLRKYKTEKETLNFLPKKTLDLKKF